MTDTDPVEAVARAIDSKAWYPSTGRLNLVRVIRQERAQKKARAAIGAYREALAANNKRVVDKQHLLDAASAVRALYSVKTAKESEYGQSLKNLYKDLYSYAALPWSPHDPTSPHLLRPAMVRRLHVPLHLPRTFVDVPRHVCVRGCDDR